MDNQKRTVGRTGTHACGDTSCGGTSVPSNVSSKQESPAFSRGERQADLMQWVNYGEDERAKTINVIRTSLQVASMWG